VSYDGHAKRLILPMGRSRQSLVFRVALDSEPGAVKLVWKDGYELHIVRRDVARAEEAPGEHRACVDLGEIHQAAVATGTGAALVISGRGTRSHKRLLSKQFGAIARTAGRARGAGSGSSRLDRSAASWPGGAFVTCATRSPER
jgi:putative transposase